MKKKKLIQLEDPIGVSLESVSEGLFRPDENKGQEHPTPEQLMIRQAIKLLTPKQQEVWEMWNFDRMTQDEIAERLGITRDAVKMRISGIEKKIVKYCRQRQEVYELLKEQEGKSAFKNHQRKVQDFHERDSKY